MSRREGSGWTVGEGAESLSHGAFRTAQNGGRLLRFCTGPCGLGSERSGRPSAPCSVGRSFLECLGTGGRGGALSQRDASSHNPGFSLH